MTSRRELFHELVHISGEVTVGDGTPLKIEGKGKILLHASDECGGFDLEFSDVLYVPKLQENLISQGTLDKKGMTIVTRNGKSEISDQGKAFLTAHRLGTLYFVTTSGSESISQLREIFEEESRKATRETATTWHERLGHLHAGVMAKIEPLANQLKGHFGDTCITCTKGKMTRSKFPTGEKSEEDKPKETLKRIHTDVMRVKTASLGGNSYFVTFIDHFSNFVTAVPLIYKSDVFEAFVNFQRRVEPSTGQGIQELQTEGGGEYTGTKVENDLKPCGILHRKSIPGTPQQNGPAERQNLTLMNVVRCLLIQSGLPKSFWAEALSTACYLRNLSPSVGTGNKIPYELWFDRELKLEKLQELKVFGCLALAACHDGDKLDDRANECIMLEYPEDMKGYRVVITIVHG